MTHPADAPLPLWARILTSTLMVAAVICLATFFYQPTLDWHTCHWAAPIMGQHIPECER